MELVTDIITVPTASTAQTAKIQFHLAQILIRVKGIYLWDYSITDIPALRALVMFDNQSSTGMSALRVLTAFGNLFYRYISPTGFDCIWQLLFNDIFALWAFIFFIDIF